jgi:hypothetical protein
MRYLVTARLKPAAAPRLRRALDRGTLGRGSIAGDEYERCMKEARLVDGLARWVEVCFCPQPLDALER